MFYFRIPYVSGHFENQLKEHFKDYKLISIRKDDREILISLKKELKEEEESEEEIVKEQLPRTKIQSIKFDTDSYKVKNLNIIEA